MKTLARPADQAEIVRRLGAVQADSARRWGRMSAHQMVCHLNDAFRMALGEKAVSQARGPMPPALLKWVALYLPLRWPAGIRTRPEIDQCLGEGTRPADFAEDRAQLLALADRVAAPATGLDGNVHPVFGRMSRRAWLRWSYLHADHHLRQFGA